MHPEQKRQLTKLPQWIQGHIAKLEADLEYYKEQAKVISGETKSPVYIGSKYEEENKQYLPINTRLIFETTTGSIEISLGREKDHIQIYGHERFLISAQATNVLWIEMKLFHE